MIAFLSTPGTEWLYSGVAMKSPWAAATCSHSSRTGPLRTRPSRRSWLNGGSSPSPRYTTPRYRRVALGGGSTVCG